MYRPSAARPRKEEARLPRRPRGARCSTRSLQRLQQRAGRTLTATTTSTSNRGQRGGGFLERRYRLDHDADSVERLSHRAGGALIRVDHEDSGAFGGGHLDAHHCNLPAI